jgi:hypothetical protein
MTEIVPWGNLPKSQEDDETIEEAIDRKIEAHDDDADSHAETDQSLDVHRTEDILDHPKASVLTDKFALNDPLLSFNWDTIDAWYQYILGSGVIQEYIGCLYLETGSTTNNYNIMRATSYAEYMAIDYYASPRFATEIQLSDNTNQLIYIMAGSYIGTGFGFKIENNKIYARSIADDNETLEEIYTIENPLNWYRLRAEYTTGESIKFYIDDVLVETITTNLPESAEDPNNTDIWFNFYIKTTTTDNRIMYVRPLYLTQEQSPT